jgi:hypothetical protein
MNVVQRAFVDQPKPAGQTFAGLIAELNARTLAAARARLIGQIRSKPAHIPTPKVETPAKAEERRRRQARLTDVQRVLTRCPISNNLLAILLGVTPRNLAYWRNGQHSPQIANWRRVQILGALLARSTRVEPRIEIIDRGRQDAAD